MKYLDSIWQKFLDLVALVGMFFVACYDTIFDGPEDYHDKDYE